MKKHFILSLLLLPYFLPLVAQEPFESKSNPAKVCPSSQSPINIRIPAKASVHTFGVQYQPSHEIVENLGHTIKLIYDQGSKVHFDGHDYQLVQVHFHTPSEHHFSRKEFEMEAHLVHTRSDSNAYLVVAVLFTKGQENKFLAKFIQDIPINKGGEFQDKKSLDLNLLLPKDTEYFHYSGSLTTPPFTEGVKWIVCKEIATASAAQINKIKSFEGINARKIQKLYHRKVEIFR
jgi:carbonic anhydrase